MSDYIRLAPMCPHCNTAMTSHVYTGYYDTFLHWMCACDTVPPGCTIAVGSYGCGHNGSIATDDDLIGG
jgi:hypothetical protein